MFFLLGYGLIILGKFRGVLFWDFCLRGLEVWMFYDKKWSLNTIGMVIWGVFLTFVEKTLGRGKEILFNGLSELLIDFIYFVIK